MIYYDGPNIALRDKIHSIIKNFESALPEQFEQTGINKCDKCNGSGLEVSIVKDSELTLWRPGEYCGFCKGFGYTGFDRVYDEYICKICNGEGCVRCANTGIVDWIKNVMGDSKIDRNLSR